MYDGLYCFWHTDVGPASATSSSTTVFADERVHGSSTVSAIGGASQRHGREAKSGDDRRNLYVLGLPFDLTK